MAIPEQEPPERKKKTVWLLVAGAASLLIPLAGAVYLHWSQNAGAAGPSGRNDVFERRDGEDHKIVPTQTAVVNSPSALMSPTPAGISGVAAKPAGSSLDFIKGNTELQARIAESKTAPAGAPPAASTAPVAPAVVPPAPVAAAKTGKPGKKEFSMPKLQTTRGFTTMGSTGSKGGSKSGAQAGNAVGGNQDMMKNLPPGAENDPRVQAYLKSHQGQ
jgi:hypothetical protein